MRHSESLARLAPALTAAQAALRPIGKDGRNPAFRSRYATLDAIIEGIRQPLAEAGLAVLQSVTHPETNADGRLVGLSVETRLLHTSGEWIAGTVVVPVSKADAQGAASAITYGRRYGLAALLALSADDDDDGNAAAKAPPPPRPAPPPEPTPGKRLHDAVPETPVERMALAKAETVTLKGQRLVDMSPERLAGVRQWAEQKGNAFVLAAIDAIEAARTADPDDDSDAPDHLDGSMPF